MRSAKTCYEKSRKSIQLQYTEKSRQAVQRYLNQTRPPRRDRQKVEQEVDTKDYLSDVQEDGM